MKDNNKTFRYIAGACFAVLVVLSIISFIQNDFDPDYILPLFIAALPAVLIAVSMFASKTGLTVLGSTLGAIFTFVAVINSLVVASQVSNLYEVGAARQSTLISTYLEILFETLFLVFWVLLLVAGLKPKSMKKLGIAAGITVAAAILFWLISNLIHGSLVLTFIEFLGYLVLIVGTLMIGLSASDNAAKEASAIANSKATVVENNPENQIDNLIKLKSLLDSGVITQEEFDQKKKQILG